MISYVKLTLYTNMFGDTQFFRRLCCFSRFWNQNYSILVVWLNTYWHKKLPNKGELVTLATSNSWKLPIRFELLEIATKYAMKTAITMHVRVTFSMNSEHFWLIERSFLFDRGLVPPSISYSVPFFVIFSTWNRYDHESPKCLFCCLL